MSRRLVVSNILVCIKRKARHRITVDMVAVADFQPYSFSPSKVGNASMCDITVIPLQNDKMSTMTSNRLGAAHNMELTFAKERQHASKFL